MSEIDQTKHVWEDLYAGGHAMAYPNDVFVRVAHRLLDVDAHHRGLEVGFGSGESLVHLARRGHEMAGTDLSASAVELTRQRLDAVGAAADLREVSDRSLPFADASFDFVLAWQVLTYNTWETLPVMVGEIDRVLRPGGRFLGTVTAPGDFMAVDSDPLGDNCHRLRSRGQEGVVIMVVPEARLPECFPGRALEVGAFGYDWAGVSARHWIVSYTT